MKSFAIAMALLEVVISAKSQVYFNKTYRDTTRYTEIATNVVRNSSGDYLIANPYAPQDSISWGAFCLKRVSNNGELLSVENILPAEEGIVYGNWAESFIEIESGYLQCTEYNDTASVIKISHSLQFEWMTRVPGLRSFERSIQLSNNQILCVSNTTEPTTLRLYWLDQFGNIVDEKVLSPFVNADFIYTCRILELSNNDLLLAGDYFLNSDAQQFIIRLNSNGDEIWKKFWDYEFRDNFIWPIVISDNEALAAFGHVDTVYNPNSADHSWYDSRIGTMRVDLDTGDTSDVILYPDVLSIPFITDFERTASGGFAILGFYQNVETFLPYSSFIMNLDPDRNLNWFKEYNHLPIEESDQQWSQAYDIDLTPDSGFVVAGTWVDPSIDNRQAPWLFKIDGCGDLQWNNCSLTEIAETPDRTAKLLAYPNPADDIIMIKCNIQNPDILWHDLNGKQCAPQLLSKQQGEWVFSTKELTQGVYAVHCISANGTSETIRVIVR